MWLIQATVDIAVRALTVKSGPGNFLAAKSCKNENAEQTSTENSLAFEFAVAAAVCDALTVMPRLSSEVVSTYLLPTRAQQ